MERGAENMEEVSRIITALIRTLNDIEVRGAKNMDALLGCIRAAEYAQGIIKKETGGLHDADA